MGLWLLLGAGGCAAPEEKPTPVLPATTAPLNALAPQLTADQVRAALVETAKATPKDPQPLLELALLERDIGDLAAAERALLDCRKRFPQYARAPLHLGLLYQSQGRSQEAAQSLRAAAALAPQDAQIQVAAGLACLQQNRTADAERFARAAKRLDPALPDSYLLLARLNDRHGTARIALEHLNAYLERSANPAPGYYLMGRIYAKQRNGQEAAQAMQRAVEADPKNPDYWVSLGRIFFENLNATHARQGVECYQKALELDPGHWEAHQYLGRALASQRNWQEAISHFQAALQNATEPGPLYYDLGQALLKAGRTEEGRQALARFRDYEAYTRGMEKLTRAIAQAPKDRRRRLALIRFCLERGQARAAATLVQDTASQLGDGPDLDAIRRQLEATRAPMTGGAPAGSGMTGSLPDAGGSALSGLPTLPAAPEASRSAEGASDGR